MNDEKVRRIPDWKWLTDLLSDFDITEKRTMRKNARDFTSLEATLYTEIQKRYKQREKPDYIQKADGGRTSKQYEDAMRIHSDQIQTMRDMGYSLMLDGFTFYEIGYELQPYDFDQNFNMHQAYEIHSFIKSRDQQIALEAQISELDTMFGDYSEDALDGDTVTITVGDIRKRKEQLAAFKQIQQPKGGE